MQGAKKHYSANYLIIVGQLNTIEQVILVGELEEIKAGKAAGLARKMEVPRMGAIIEVNDGNFGEQVMARSSETPVLVDFHAGWCAPCQMIAPVLEKIANDYAGRIVLAKLNTEENPRTSNAAGVSSIPANALVKGGRIVDGFVGYRPEGQIREWLDKNLAK